MSTIATDDEIARLVNAGEDILKRPNVTGGGRNDIAEPRPASLISSHKKAQGKTPSFAGGNPEALDFPDPLSMLVFYNPDKKPYLWQKRELLRMAGYTRIHKGDIKTRVRPTDADPMYYTLVAANGSGKDAYFIAPFAVWFCGAKIRSKCIITSSSDEQLKHQTFAYIKAYCERINAKHGIEIFEIVDKHIRCHRTGSEIRLFVTNTAGRAEGNHPYDDWPGAEMAFICNEAKSVEPALWTGFQRFTGYNYWLEVSSPGERAGHFYDSVKRSAREDHKLSSYFCTRVTAFDCPHISKAHLDMMRTIHGENSLFWLTSVLAEFYEDSDQVVIPFTMANYIPPLENSYGLDIHAGLDLSLGGDETVLSIWRGNIFIAQETTRIKNATVLRDWIISKLSDYNINPSNVNVDGGGLGKPIIHALWEQGCDVRSVKNDERAFDANNYRNRGAEIWFRFKRLVETQTLRLPIDPIFRAQLTSRRYSITGGKVLLESKPDARSRGAQSPDRADAAVLAFAHLSPAYFLAGEKAEDADERMYREQGVTPLHVTPENFAQLERKLRMQKEADKETTRPAHIYTAGAPTGKYDYYQRN